MSGVIQSKDQKILWARAAGRCSMPECRVKLTLDKHEADQSITLGEMCHIVGEKDSDKSPRGSSKLPLKDRNLYSNLILLCPTHHRLIDKNETDWPIELLYKIKIEHELWVEESLTNSIDTPETIVYSTIIDGLSHHLKLDQWNSFIESAVRNIVDAKFFESAFYIKERKLAISWPNSNPELEESIINLMDSFLDYLSHFEKYAYLNIPERVYREDKSYQNNPIGQKRIIERNRLWADKNFHLLCIYAIRLNEFVAKVRESFNPLFYIAKGNFLIIDSLGFQNNGIGYIYSPKYTETNNKLKNVDRKIKKFEAKNK